MSDVSATAPKKLSKNIYRLGLLSLFNDFTADMITPLLPVYLATLGVGPGFLGAMEGVANLVAYATMLLAGVYVDRRGRNKRVMVVGYALCAAVRLLLVIPFAPLVFAVRVLDRMGKGLRTVPRDGLITHFAPNASWGRAFGIQRAMDHAGSLMGAGVAAYLLARWDMPLTGLFLIAAVPSVLSLLLVPRKIPEIAPEAARESTPAPFRLSWRDLPPGMRRYLGVIFCAALTTPSDLFVLLKMQELGLAKALLPVAWLAMTFFSLLAAYAGGRLADRWSRRGTIGLGWLLYAAVFAGFAFNQSLPLAWGLLAVYGVQSGLVEAAERTYPMQLADPKTRATALGWYYLAYGLGLLPASLIFGLLWNTWGSQGAFLLYAGLTLITVFMIRWLPDSRQRGVADPTPLGQTP